MFQHQKQHWSAHTNFYHFYMHICIFVHFLSHTCSHVSTLILPVQALLSITREQKCLEITAPHLLNSSDSEREVLISSAKTEWLAAMKREFDTIVLNGTFELCPLPPGWKAISMCWVLKIKHDGSYRARWVARGA